MSCETPLASGFLTFWMPLTPVPAGGSSLVYAVGSHRDFALPFHHDADEDLSGRYRIRTWFHHL